MRRAILSLTFAKRFGWTPHPTCVRSCQAFFVSLARLVLWDVECGRQIALTRSRVGMPPRTLASGCHTRWR